MGGPRVRRGLAAVAALVIVAVFLTSLACISAVVTEYSRLAESAKRANEMVAMKESEDIAVLRVGSDAIEVYNRGSMPAVITGYFKVNPAGQFQYVKIDQPVIVPAASSKQISIGGTQAGWRVGVATSNGNSFWEEKQPSGQGGQLVPPGQTAYVTFAAEGLGSYASGSTVLNVDGQIYTYDNLPKTFAWASGSTHSFEWTSPAQGLGAKYTWTSTRGLSAKQSDSSFTVNANGYVIATYKAQYQLSTSVNPSGAGSVSLNPSSPDGYYDSGSNVTATAAPSAGCVFNKWQLDGADYSTSNPTAVIMDAPHSLTAVFSTYTLTVYRSGTATGVQGVTVKVDVDYIQVLNPSGSALHTWQFTGSVVMQRTGTYEDYGYIDS
jgi:hypothetical protein